MKYSFNFKIIIDVENSLSEVEIEIIEKMKRLGFKCFMDIGEPTISFVAEYPEKNVTSPYN